MPARHPDERSLVASIAIHQRWAVEDPKDPDGPLARARAQSPADLSYWEHQADPDSVLEPKERNRRATHLQKAHFARLSLKGVQARRARRADAAAVSR